jgi:hypothetical protein
MAAAANALLSNRNDSEDQALGKLMICLQHGGLQLEFDPTPQINVTIEKDGGKCVAILCRRTLNGQFHDFVALCYHPKHNHLGIDSWHWHAKPMHDYVVPSVDPHADFSTTLQGSSVALNYKRQGNGDEAAVEHCEAHYWFHEPMSVNNSNELIALKKGNVSGPREAFSTLADIVTPLLD